MRPKKVILLIDKSELRLSTLSYFLWIRGFRVLAAMGAEEAIRLADGVEVSLVILQDSGFQGEWNGLSLELKRHIDAALLYLSSRTFSVEDDPYYDHLLWRDADPAQLLDLVHVLSSRKRGPKKKPVAA